jgi:hypothetical protein
MLHFLNRLEFGQANYNYFLGWFNKSQNTFQVVRGLFSD